MAANARMTNPDQDWVAEFFADADRHRVPALVAWFADDIEVRFGNAPAIVGKAAATEAFEQFYSSISGMRHAAEVLVVDGSSAAQFAVVTYTRPDGSAVSLPVASHLRRAGERLLDRLWIFIDMAPLFAGAA